MSSRSIWLGAGAFVASCLVTGAVMAQPSSEPPDERARIHFESGAVYYDSGEYESALREFQSAYELSHRAALYFNIYLCQQAIGDLDEAAASLETYLSEVEDAPNRASLQQRLENLRERIRRREAGEAEPEEPELSSSTEPVPVEPPPPPPSGDALNVPAIVGYSVAGLGLIGAAIFGPLTIAENSSLASSSCGQAMTCTVDQTSTLTTYALVTDISFGVALVGAIAGTVLFFVIDTSGGSGQSSLRFSPLAGPGLAGINVGGTL